VRTPLVSLALAAAIAAAPAVARADAPAGIRGRVVDPRGRAVAGATVAAGGGVTATTDADGRFVLPDATAAGDVFVYAEGYLPATAAVSADGAVEVVLSTESSSGEVIEMTGRAPDEGTATSYELSRDEVRTLPGAGNDVLKAAQSLPGAARIPYGLGGLVLRGQAPRDSNVYLDGVEVPIVYHFGGITSFYPSTMLDAMEVVPGGFGAAYGRGQGGVVTLSTRSARTDRVRAGGEISLVDASAHAEAPAAGGGVVVGLRRSWIDAILAAVLSGDDRILPRYYDGQLRWSRGDAARAGGEWTALTFFSLDELIGPDARFRSGFVRAAARWRRRWGATALTATPWLGYDKLGFQSFETGDDGEEQTTSELSRSLVPGGLRVDVTRDLRWGHLAAGVDVQGGHSSSTVLDDDEGRSMPLTDSRWWADVGLWTEAHARLAGGRLGVTPGLRLERLGLSGEWVLDPRLRASQTLAPWLTVRETLGLYHQPPPVPDLDPQLGNPGLGSSYATQASLGAELALPGAVTASITGFAVDSARLPAGVMPPDGSQAEPPERNEGGLGAVMRQLLEEQLGSFEYRTNVGRGRSRGVELSVKRRGDGWVAWLSYTLSRTERTDDPARFVGWRRYELDQTHNLSLVATTRVGRWQLGGRFRWVTGNPYTPDYDPADDGASPAPLSARLPDFVQLDLRMDREWRRRWGTMRFFLDVQNVTNALNPEAATENEGRTEYVRGLPIFPSLGVEYVPVE